MPFNKDNLRRARELREMTKMDLAFRVGAGQASVSNWESGARVPKVATVRRLAKALGVPLATLDPDFAADLLPVQGRAATGPPGPIEGQGANPCAGKPQDLGDLCRNWDNLSDDARELVLAVVRTANRGYASRADRATIAARADPVLSSTGT